MFIEEQPYAMNTNLKNFTPKDRSKTQESLSETFSSPPQTSNEGNEYNSAHDSIIAEPPNDDIDTENYSILHENFINESCITIPTKDYENDVEVQPLVMNANFKRFRLKTRSKTLKSLSKSTFSSSPKSSKASHCSKAQDSIIGTNAENKGNVHEKPINEPCINSLLYSREECIEKQLHDKNINSKKFILKTRSRTRETKFRDSPYVSQTKKACH